MEPGDVASFVAFVDAGSVTKAAAAQGVPTSTVSRRIRRLEEALGVPLVVRAARSLVMTEHGQAVYERAKPAIDSLTTLRADVLDHGDVPRGVLVLTAPPDVSRAWFFADLLLAFRDRYPSVRVEVRLDASYVDLAVAGVDLALRAHGDVIPGDGSLRVKRLCATRLGFFASERYLAQKGTPSSLEDLDSHELLAHHTLTRQPLRVFSDASESTVDLRHSSFVANDMSLVSALAWADAGIAALPVADTTQEANRGLRHVLPAWSASFGHLSLVWPGGRFVPPRVRAFVEIAGERLGGCA